MTQLELLNLTGHFTVLWNFCLFLRCNNGIVMNLKGRLPLSEIHCKTLVGKMRIGFLITQKVAEADGRANAGRESPGQRRDGYMGTAPFSLCVTGLTHGCKQLKKSTAEDTQ